MELRGIIIRIDKRICAIYSEGKKYRALYTRSRIKGAYHSQLRPVAVGDDVVFEPGENRLGWIKRVFPRSTSLARNAVGEAREQVVVANVDQICIVSSICAPPFRPGIIDRLLVGAEKGNLQPIIILNKSDLKAREKRWDRVCEKLKVYEETGYPVLYTSATTGDGIPKLKERLKDKSTVFAGHSGVGKSALLVAVDPNLQLKIKEVSRKRRRGQHTTTSVTLLPLPIGGFVVDTPGMREFSLWQVEAAELGSYFPDIAKYAGQCRYKSCLHIPEPDCAVKKAVEEHKIAPFRYESYCRILESMKEGKSAKICHEHFLEGD